MQTHRDKDFRDDWLRSLEEKADRMQSAGESQITAGKPDEVALATWKSHKVGVMRLPDDEQGILRISIGESEEPVPLAYCVFRGEHNACCKLLRKALAAMEKGPG